MTADRRRDRTAAALAAVTDVSEFAWAWRLRRRGAHRVHVREREVYFEAVRSAPRVVAPVRVAGPREAWERMVAAGLLPESVFLDRHRAFEVCLTDWNGCLAGLDAPWTDATSPYWKDDTETMTELVTRLAPQPAEVELVVDCAARWPERLAAEELGLELGRRVAARAGDRAAPERVVWADRYLWQARFVAPHWLRARDHGRGEAGLCTRIYQAGCCFVGAGRDREVVMLGRLG